MVAVDHNEQHRQDVDWLRSSLQIIADQEPHRSVLIASHHAPTFQGTSEPRHAGNPWSSAFATELLMGVARDWKGFDQVKCGVFGHTHYSTDFQMGALELCANQRGYVVDGKQGLDSVSQSRGPRDHRIVPDAIIEI